MTANANDMQEAPLRTCDRDTVITVATIVVFVLSCKMYNHFIARANESFSDVDITKMVIIGIFSIFATRAAITALFEQPISLRATATLTSPPTVVDALPVTGTAPQLTRLVR